MMFAFRVVLMLAFGLVLNAQAECSTEGFDNGSNVGEWAFSTGTQILPDGGNPGYFLYSLLDTNVPMPRSNQEGTVFTGDYRSRGVTSLSVDLITLEVGEGLDPAEFPCTIFLRDYSGTPSDSSDDWLAYLVGSPIPLPDEGWISYEFAIPSQADEWPDAWGSAQMGNSAPPPDWQELMSDVDEVGFRFGSFEWAYIWQTWSVGLDNVSICYDEGVAVEPISWTGVKNLFE